jgi:arsenate reductase
MSNGLLLAKSAGSQPVGEVHPLSIKYLSQTGYSTQGLRSQSWEDFEEFQPDLVITVCDSAAGEACPVYFGKSVKVHWGLRDPSKVFGSENEKEQAFLMCIDEIVERVNKLIMIAEKNLAGDNLRFALKSIGPQ